MDLGQQPFFSTRFRGAALLQSKKWSDCAFLVGSEPNHVEFHGHKLILAMASPVFEAMFYSGFTEKSGSIKIKDIQPDTFQALLEYIYADRLYILSIERACDLYYVAKKYMLSHLAFECSKYLWTNLNTRNAGLIYEFAKLFDESSLMAKCLQKISLKTKTAIFDPSFADLKLSTVITIFSLDNLCIDSELDLFDAAVQYFKAQRTKRGTFIPEIEESNSLTTNISKDVTPMSNAPKNDANLLEKTKQAEATDNCTNEKSLSTCCSRDETPMSDASKNDVLKSYVQVLEEAKQTEAIYNCCNEENANKSIMSVLGQIRFLTLTAEQFADGPAQSSLLTESESYAFLINILSSAGKVPMPEGFSTSRIKRKRELEQTTSAFSHEDDTKYHKAKMGSEVIHQGNWNVNYPAQFTISMNGKLYIYGQSEEKNWFIREVLSDGKISNSDYSNGVWDRYYSINFPYQINGRHFLCNSFTDEYQIIIRELLEDGKMGSITTSGHKKLDWNTIVPFSITGKQFVYYQDYHDKIGSSWAIQASSVDGNLGNIIQESKWNAAYKTAFIFYMKDKPYVYCAGVEKWFIREILPNAKMGPQTDQGFWSNNYDISIPFSFRDKQYVYFYVKSVSFWKIRELLAGGVMGKGIDSGYWTHKYDVMLPFSINDRTFIYGNCFQENGWFIREIVSSVTDQTF